MTPEIQVSLYFISVVLSFLIFIYLVKISGFKCLTRTDIIFGAVVSSGGPLSLAGVLLILSLELGTHANRPWWSKCVYEFKAKEEKE